MIGPNTLISESPSAHTPQFVPLFVCCFSQSDPMNPKHLDVMIYSGFSPMSPDVVFWFTPGQSSDLVLV